MKNLKSIVVTVVAIVISAISINATPVNSFKSNSADEPLTVKYNGVDGIYPVFEVTVNSDNARKTSFAISDKEEGEIYTSYFQPANTVMLMKIEKRENQELDFKLMIGKEVYSKSFAVLSTVIMEAK